MSGNENLAKAAKQAEHSTKDIKDESLRKIAFDRILSHLLETTPQHRQTIMRKTKLETKAAYTSKRPSAAKSSGPKAWVRELADESFFKTPKNLSEILEELSNRSHHLKAQDLTRPLETLCHEKTLRRKKLVIKAKGASKKERAVFHWSNW